jgi:hypothetical protein
MKDPLRIGEAPKVLVSARAQESPRHAMLGIAAMADDAAVLHGGDDAARIGAVAGAGGSELGHGRRVSRLRVRMSIGGEASGLIVARW